MRSNNDNNNNHNHNHNHKQGGRNIIIHHLAINELLVTADNQKSRLSLLQLMFSITWMRQEEKDRSLSTAQPNETNWTYSGNAI